MAERGAVNVPDRFDRAKATRLRDELHDAVAESITSASGSGRTVTDPSQAAEYVVNMLTVHRTDLLAELAAMFHG